MKKVFIMVVLLFIGFTNSYADNELFKGEVVEEVKDQALSLKITEQKIIIDEEVQAPCSDFAHEQGMWIASQGGNYYQAYFEGFSACIGVRYVHGK